MTAAIGDSSPGVRGKAASLAVGRPVNRLYGRDHELGLLTDLLSRDAGGALVVRASPGSGSPPCWRRRSCALLSKESGC